jgi:hypothetical protein
MKNKRKRKKMLRKHEILRRIQLRQSTIKDWLTCPLMFHFRHVEKREPAFIHPAAVHGSALHLAIHEWHKGTYLGPPEQIYASALKRVLEDNVEHCIKWALSADADLKGMAEHGREILDGYFKADHNRSVSLILSEAPFRMRYGGYFFTGTIDQVRRTPSGEIHLVDLKSSSQRPNTKSLRMDWQLNLYATALRFGEIQIDGIWRRLGLQVDETQIYFLRAHEIYKRGGKYGKKGDEKGNPIYGCSKHLHELKQFRYDLKNIVQLLSWDKPLPNPQACSFCAYTAPCKDRSLTFLTTQVKKRRSRIQSENPLDIERRNR